MSTQSILSMHSVNFYVHTTISIIETLYFINDVPLPTKQRFIQEAKEATKIGLKMMHDYCLRLTWHITVSPQISPIEPFITFIFIN
jgi:acyl carrier protein phosphodiesterase